jgi:acyl carrier protein
MSDVWERVRRSVAKHWCMEEAEVTPATEFERLGTDEMEMFELVMELEQEFDIGEVAQEAVVGFKTVGDVVVYVERAAKG